MSLDSRLDSAMAEKKIQGTLTEGEVDHLIKIASFVKKVFFEL